jgi:hypothetical protein
VKLKERMSSALDRCARALPYLTSWLWLPGLVGTAYFGMQWASSGEEGQTVLCGLATVFGIFALVARHKKWRAEAWLSLLTWVSAISVGNLVLADIWLPSLEASLLNLDTFLYFPGSIWESALRYAGHLLSLRWLVAVCTFAFAFELHRRSLMTSGSRTMAIGGRWKVVPVILVSAFVASLFETFSPLSLAVSSLFYLEEASGLVYALEWIVNWIDVAVILTVGFAFYAWKSSARLTVGELGIRIGFADEGLGLVLIPWRHVLRMRELVSRGRRETVSLEVGKLPFFRTRLSFHRSRDGREVLDRVYKGASSHGVQARGATVRRWTVLWGWVTLASAFVCVWIVQRTIEVSSIQMAEADDLRLSGFAGQDHFVFLGVLTAVAALLLGFGLGLLFVRTEGGVRAVPLVGTAIAASMLPDPMIYWLVYIAIYAILIAVQGTIEPSPFIPFPDNAVSTLGLWLVEGTPIFAVFGYVLASLIAIKPWHHALPSWPYRAFWRRAHATDEAAVSAAVALGSTGAAVPGTQE